VIVFDAPPPPAHRQRLPTTYGANHGRDVKNV
jgi:hypothetical protein